MFAKYSQLATLMLILCCLIRRKARVEAPGKTSKRKYANNSSAISSEQITGKNFESK